MSRILTWLQGRKTYIVAGASVIYGVLAIVGVAPNPDKLAAWSIAIALYAAAFRSTLGRFLADLITAAPVESSGAEMGSTITENTPIQPDEVLTP